MSKLNELLVGLKDNEGKLMESIGMIQHAGGRVEIHYTAELIDTKLDGRIKRAMQKIGYRFTGSGYLFSGSRRDIGFEKVA